MRLERGRKMRASDLYFNVNDRIRIENKNYIVTGKINFLNEQDGCNWTEYRLIDEMNASKVSWLSIDIVYHEYALYQMSTVRDEQTIQRQGYHKVDEGTAKIMDFEGNVDVEYAEEAHFQEYEDKTEEKIIALEVWGNEIECSTGYYLDASEINFVTSGGVSQRSTVARAGTRNAQVEKMIILVAVLISLMGVTILGVSASSNNLVKALKKNSQFSYVTSITSDIDNKQKADVYQTSLSVEEAAKAILKLAGKSVESVDESTEDGTVAIMTKKYYCLVYEGEAGNTLVQVSNRKYAYTSRQQPYHSRSSTYRYYRRYYYTTGYFLDNERYSGTSAYDDYSDGTINVNNNNRYKNYSDTIRQDSVATRNTSGGGTSSGK